MAEEKSERVSVVTGMSIGTLIGASFGAAIGSATAVCIIDGDLRAKAAEKGAIAGTTTGACRVVFIVILIYGCRCIGWSCNWR